MFMSGETTGTASSAKPEKTVRLPCVLGVGLTAATLLSDGLTGHRVGEGDVAVEVRVAIVALRLAPALDADRDAEIAAGQREQVGLGELEVGQRRASSCDRRCSSNLIASIAAWDEGVQSPIAGVALQPPLNGL